MPSTKNRKKQPSLATQRRGNKRLFLPLDAADADKLALRFRMAFTRAIEGTAEEADACCLVETVISAALIADFEGSYLDDADLITSEDCLRRKLQGVEAANWRLSENEARSLRAVINEHDRQLRQTRLQNLVKATERLERLLKSTETLAEVFDARRAENVRAG